MIDLMMAAMDALVIFPDDLIGAAAVAAILGLDKSSVTRRAASGKLPYLAQLDGPRGAYVFNRPDVIAWANEKGIAAPGGRGAHDQE